MAELNLSPNIDHPDAFYEDLIRAHDGLSDEESVALNARLVLILANQIGSRDVLQQALTMAKSAGS